MVTTGNPTARRKRAVRWAKRARRLGLAWDNALEIARAGRLTAPYGAPFEVIVEERVYRLRRYAAAPAPGVRPVAAPLLLVPPLMVASEVYDISPDVSAVAFLGRAGVDVWLVDFGAPEREAGGMDRTLDDHVRAVAESIERVRAETGHDVHVAGYSQGGMFCYQAAAFRRSAGVASVITMGSPVDLHRTLQVNENTTERLLGGLRSALAWPLAHIEGLPGMFTSTGFKLFSARKEAAQLLDFVRNLHDRSALEKREAKRLFLGGEGFVAWPGPAFRKFVDELIVGNRMASGGFVIDGRTVTLADLACPILYFVGSRDEMGKPAAVRGIRRAAPAASAMYEVQLKAGHFGLVVGTTAQTVTWPTVIEWMRWVEHDGPVPAIAIDVRSGEPPAAATPDDHHDDQDGPDDHDAHEGNLELARDVLGKTAHAVVERIGELSGDLSSYVDHVRWQLPRLNRLRSLHDDTLISLGRTLAHQADKIGDRTFFLWRGRAFTYADANRRVDAIARGLIASGFKPGDRIGVMMQSRPSHLSVVTAINRLGAVAVLLSPDTADDVLPRALQLGEAESLITDPEHAARAHAAIRGQVLVLGGVGEQAPDYAASGASVVPAAPVARVIPAGVLDMEAIDPDTVTLPAWYRPDAGQARDLAMVFVSSGRVEPPRATRITNRRWAFAALGAAAAATLTTRDTVYCCLPLHHPSGTLVAAGSAVIGGARLALASTFRADTFWAEVRRYGASVVFYAGDMCRLLVDAPSVVGENNNPVRLFAGSGMRADVWRRLVDRFGPVGVLELYASTEANTVLANTAGKKIGSVGRPLPGSPEVAIAAWNFGADELVRDGAGRLLRARLDEPGMLVARMSGRAGADIAHIDPRRLLRDAFEPGDTWFVTGDFFRVDTVGDYWFVDRSGQMIITTQGAIASTRVEDALYEAGGIALCIAAGRDEAELDHHPGPHVAPAKGPTIEVPIAAIVLAPGTAIDLPELSAAARTLPEYARPRRVRVVDHTASPFGAAADWAQVPAGGALPMTDGFRPIKRVLRELDMSPGAGVYTWDARAQHYVATHS